MDDTKRIALVETLTRDNGVTISNTVSVQRYQLSNNIESATLELDDTAQIISYEEYYPYGDTSYQAGRSESEVSQKRYRYTGKEKDEESGLYYMLARYYSGWLGRWTAADPAGMVDGVNLYAYCRGNPVIASDPSGTDTERSWVEVDENGVQTLHYRRGGARGGFDGGNEGESDTSSENPSETNNVILESGSIDKNSFIEKLISDMKDKKMNVEWLEGIKNQVKAIEFRNLEDTATAVATKDDKIIINSKHFSEVNEENYKEIQSIILHELVHIWQNKTGQVSAEKERKWMGTVKNEDGTRNIFNEVEAYTIQLEFMKNMKIEATETGLKAIKEEFRKIEMGSIDLSGHLGGNTFSKIENPKQLEMKNKAKYLLKNYKEMDKGKQENKKHNYAFPRPTQ
jgi:RHS repeat-associated protein